MREISPSLEHAQSAVSDCTSDCFAAAAIYSMPQAPFRSPYSPTRSDTLTAVDVDRRIARAVEVNADAPFPSPIPTPRGGALCWPLSPYEALLFSGSNHGDESEMLAPWLLTVPLPRTP